MAIDYVTIRNKNNGNAIYSRTSWKLLDDIPEIVTSDDLNGADITWHGVTTNVKLAWGLIKYRIQNNILYIVGGGALAEDPSGDIFFSIPGISGKISGTVLYAWNSPDGSWNRYMRLDSDGTVTQWNCVKNFVFEVNVAIPLDD